MAILKYWVLNIYWFKAFLATQDDSITDEEAASKYNEYKLEFRRQQLNEFFSNHKVIINPTETKDRRTSSKMFLSFAIMNHLRRNVVTKYPLRVQFCLSFFGGRGPGVF